MSAECYDLAIIGGGQAGLAAAYQAKQENLDYIVFEGNEHIGQSWRDRYDSLTLFTPRRYSSLPDLPMDGDQDGYPTKDEVATYLERYVDHHQLAVHLGEPVTELQKTEELFHINTPRASYQSQSVVIATAPFQTPRVPEWHTELSIQNLHSAEYRNPSQIDGDEVLIVGGGNSGAQIAEELAEHHDVTMAVASDMRFMQANLLGKSLFWWLDMAGLLNAPTGTMRSKILERRGDPIIGTSLKEYISNGIVAIKPAAQNGIGDSVTFADTTSETFDAVVWCTGYTQEYPWLRIAGALDESGRPYHQQGVAVNVERLCFMGLGWMRSRNSALLGGVGRDAKQIIQTLAQQIQKRSNES